MFVLLKLKDTAVVFLPWVAAKVHSNLTQSRVLGPERRDAELMTGPAINADVLLRFRR
jgi:hypothetical protein